MQISPGLVLFHVQGTSHIIYIYYFYKADGNREKKKEEERCRIVFKNQDLNTPYTTVSKDRGQEQVYF